MTDNARAVGEHRGKVQRWALVGTKSEEGKGWGWWGIWRGKSRKSRMLQRGSDHSILSQTRRNCYLDSTCYNSPQISPILPSNSSLAQRCLSLVKQVTTSLQFDHLSVFGVSGWDSAIMLESNGCSLWRMYGFWWWIVDNLSYTSNSMWRNPTAGGEENRDHGNWEEGFVMMAKMADDENSLSHGFRYLISHIS